MPDRCTCRLCKRNRRVDYIVRIVGRTDDIAARWLEGLYDHLLDMETEVEMYERG